MLQKALLFTALKCEIIKEYFFSISDYESVETLFTVILGFTKIYFIFAEKIN